jgi:hypothetical protein
MTVLLIVVIIAQFMAIIIASLGWYDTHQRLVHRETGEIDAWINERYKIGEEP